MIITNTARNIVNFLRNCNARNLSLKTISTYEERLVHFNKYLLKKNIIDVEKISVPLLEEYFGEYCKKYSPTTVRGKYIVLRAFFNYLVEYGVLDISPLRVLKSPKYPKRFVKAFTREEVAELLSMYDKETFTGCRNYTINLVLFSTGMRRSELINVCIVDIEKDYSSIHVIGKGDKERYIPISDNLGKVLRHYMKIRKAHLIKHRYCESPALFISAWGKPLTATGINTIFQNMKKCKKRWSTKVSAHTWRHTFAKMFLLNGGDVFTLQKILGHEDVSTTRIYVDLNRSEIEMQNRKYNPLDNSRWKYY